MKIKEYLNEVRNVCSNFYFIPILTIAFLLLLISFTDFFDYLSDDDFQSGMLAEIHGIFIEIILIVYLYAWWERRKENKEWRPTRLLVARNICSVHQVIFNSIKFTLDCNYHTNLNIHGFPSNISQKQADAWAREHQVNHLPFKLNKLKKMIEYSNVALNSSMHPKVITFMVEAEEIVNNLEFILTAYKGNGNFIGSFNLSGVEKMEQIYREMQIAYFEVQELEKIPNGPLISYKEIEKLLHESNKDCGFLELRIK